MALLDMRQATLDVTEPCARCGRPVGGPPLAAGGAAAGALPRFYLFPTGNAFHGVCLAAEVGDLAAPAQAARISSLTQRLAKARPPPWFPTQGREGERGQGERRGRRGGGGGVRQILRGSRW